MVISFRKLTAYTVGVTLGCMALLPESVISQQVSPTASNITGSWQFSSLANTSPGFNQLRITHNTSSNVISGRIYNTTSTPGQCIEGFYLPASRRVTFIRKQTIDCTSPPIQFYEGWVAYTGQSMGLTYHVWNYSGSALPLPESGLDFGVFVTRVSNTP